MLIVGTPMPEPFDPYSQWLGIEPHEMPVDHYRMLGIERFESDPAAISAAADERMTLVRTYQMGPRASYTQKLLNELAAARVCLLNPGAKASYDQVLEAIFFTSAPPPPLAQIASPRIEEDYAQEGTKTRSRSKPWVAALIIVLLIGACTVVALVQLRQGSSLEQTPPAQVSPIGELLLYEPESEEREPILMYQEGDGSVNLDASFAELHGPTLRLGISGSVNVISEWESMDDWVSWVFKIVKVPPQGIFHVHVTYAARPESNGGKFVIAVGDQEKECDIRGTGGVVTDEYFIAIPDSGDHTLTVRAKSKPAERLMTLKSVQLAFPSLGSSP